ncbi:PQQ-binding-like beta-propeller repeat protein [Dactylosporangium sp. AC04546]|uniref:outer membrane protein assembly factor BamB family protein n=1 Tax=Dactylosporangium sp. AC04546 TaxID=2862460 RepID=UPI001EDD4660|nr:PQQ-binding-like beta-propeller repeat protein [Dactylosporangium sp. AC04546]WVK82069.1 PQQ-binding-like beta-propeller repeat protein [Dactylosporangium sp. AC04546]
MRRFSDLVLLVLFAVGAPFVAPAGATTVAADASWRQDGGDPGRSGHQPVASPLGDLEVRWTAPANRDEEQVGGAVVVDGTLFRSAGGPTGQVRRYDAVTGADLGPIVDVPARRFGRLAVVGGAVVVESVDVGSAVRRLGAYTMTGHQRWEIVLPDDVSGGYTVGDGLILRSAGSAVTAYSLADGAVAWTAPLGGEAGLHPPVIEDGLVLQASGDPAVLSAFDATTGRPAWQRAVSGAELVARAGAVYAVGDGGVCAYAVRDGAERWCAPRTADPVGARPGGGGAGPRVSERTRPTSVNSVDVAGLGRPRFATVSDQALFVVGDAGKLAAIRTTDGAVDWVGDYGLGWEVDTSYWAPVNGGGVVYVVAYHFDARDGDVRHRTDLTAFSATDGRLVSRVDLGFDSLQGAEPLLLTGDHVYFAALERLYALAARRPRSSPAAS